MTADSPTAEADAGDGPLDMESADPMDGLHAIPDQNLAPARPVEAEVQGGTLHPQDGSPSPPINHGVAATIMEASTPASGAAANSARSANAYAKLATTRPMPVGHLSAGIV